MRSDSGWLPVTVQRLAALGHRSESSSRLIPGGAGHPRIGSVKDGKVTAFIAAPSPDVEMPEGVAADMDGNVFGGFTTKPDLKKFAKN